MGDGAIECIDAWDVRHETRSRIWTSLCAFLSASLRFSEKRQHFSSSWPPFYILIFHNFTPSHTFPLISSTVPLDTLLSCCDRKDAGFKNVQSCKCSLEFHVRMCVN